MEAAHTRARLILIVRDEIRTLLLLIKQLCEFVLVLGRKCETKSGSMQTSAPSPAGALLD